MSDVQIFYDKNRKKSGKNESSFQNGSLVKTINIINVI